MLVLLAPACTPLTEPAQHQPVLVEQPAGFPAQNFPSDNQPTAQRIALGKRLFFSTALSADNSVACASCHRPELAFADDRAVSVGVAGRQGKRNAPSLANVGYYPYYMREGAVPTLEMQVLAPVQEHDEFDMNILAIVDRLKSDTTITRMSMEAYSREVDAFVVTRAIAAFERTLVSGNSRYDRVTRSEAAVNHANPSESFSESEARGKSLFFSERAQCSSCHGGFAFTNHAFANNGLYESYADDGRYKLTRNLADKALFKTPSLRNVAVTAPYMHDGSIATLEAVVAHYNTGGRNHFNRSGIVRPLQLSTQEQQDLVRFLRTLTDEEFNANPAYRP